MHYHTIIIGAGPSGLFAAQALGGQNRKVLILERNKVPGKKLLLAGAGQCNFTHGGEIDTFFEHYGDNGKFLRKAFSLLNNQGVKRFFEKIGVPSEERDNGKVFPKSKRSQDIVDVLIRECKKKGVEVQCGVLVKQISEYDTVFTIETANAQRYSCEHVVVATGGASFPQTGSDGAGYQFAKNFGHTVISPKASLTSIDTRETIFRELSGIAFEEVSASLWRDQKKIKECKGSLLFTHRGLSGPMILDYTRWMEKEDVLEINFLYPQTYEEVKNIFAKEIPMRGKEEILSFLKRMPVPKSFCEVICNVANIEGHLHCAKISREQREALVNALTKHRVTVARVGSLQSAMATAGGVKLKEINPTTMESRKQKGLYFIGEVLDIDGDTGGYNIQAAFSMGALCAKHIGQKK